MDGGSYSKENRRVKKEGDRTRERKIKERIRKRMIKRRLMSINYFCDVELCSLSLVLFVIISSYYLSYRLEANQTIHDFILQF